MVTAAAARQPVLELTGIGKDFGAIRALHDMDIQIFPGEVVGLMGDNGAGKSTLVKIIRQLCAKPRRDPLRGQNGAFPPPH